MTTIACNKESMYGDLQWTHGQNKWKGDGKVFKIKPNPDFPVKCPFLIGMAGTVDDIMIVRSFFQYPELVGRPPRLRGSVNGLVLTFDGDIFTFEKEYTTWTRYNEPYSAVGSGRDLAIGAMSAGKTPKEAVKIAAQRDIFTGMGVKGFNIY